MSCYHPLKAWQIGLHELTGRPAYKVTSYSAAFVYRDKPDHWITSEGSGSESKDEYDKWYFRCMFGAWSVQDKFIEIPCGHCIGCRLDYSRTWANRMLLELQYHEAASFITLTYDDKHLPHNEYIDPETGVVMVNDTLYPRDLQLWLKKLRRAYKKPLRFYAAGEYGSKTARPHYHVIVFGLEVPDKQFYKQSRGYKYYTSKWLDEIWEDDDGDKKPRGFTVVGDVTWESCAYVARYCTKKASGALGEMYEVYNLVPEFSRMSRRPGIAAQYYADHKDDIYENDQIDIATPKGGISSKPPRFYDLKFDIEYPERMAAIKDQRRKRAELLSAAKLQQSDLSYIDLLSVAEDYKLQQVKLLHREL